MRRPAVMLTALVLLSGCTRGPVGPPPSGANASPVAADFIGTWDGAWDETFKLQLVVAQAGKDEFTVTYRWEETLGQPLRTLTLRGKLVNGALVADAIDLWLFTADPDKAWARGNFERPRTSDLKRQRPAGPQA